MSREYEKELARKMKDGDEEAKKVLTDSYLPLFGSYLKRYTRNPSLDMIYRGIEVLEKSVSTFDFQSDNHGPNATFVYVLSYGVRKMMTRYIADRPIK